MPADWRQSSVGSSTQAAELPAVVATKVDVVPASRTVFVNLCLSLPPWKVKKLTSLIHLKSRLNPKTPKPWTLSPKS